MASRSSRTWLSPFVSQRVVDNARKLKGFKLGPASIARVVISALGLVGGIIHVIQDWTNPAVWLLMYFWSFPAIVSYWYETVGLKLPEPKRWPLLITLTFSLLVSLLALSLTLAMWQIEGVLTYVIWGIVAGLFWVIAILGVDKTIDWRITRGLATHLRRVLGKPKPVAGKRPQKRARGKTMKVRKG